MAEYIERTEYITKTCSECGCGCELEDYACSAVKHVMEFQTADVAPVKHGRWINWGKSGTPTYENYGTCSVCHEDAEIHTENRNYCPNCGAKMDLDT